MTVDVSFNFQWLSLTTIFVFKQFMIVDDSWKKHAMRSHKRKKIRWTLSSPILFPFYIFVKRLRNEDTEAYQEMMKMKHGVFCEYWRLYWSFYYLPFWQNCWPKNCHSLSSVRSNGKNYHQLSCRIWTCPNYMIVINNRCRCIIVHVQMPVIVETINNFIHGFRHGGQGWFRGFRWQICIFAPV